MLGTATAQQHPASSPRNWSPSAADPQYAARKQARMATQSATTVRPTLRPAGPLARPACFEPFDTTAAGGWSQVPREDDNSFGPVALGWNFSLFGTTYNNVYINTNGNVTFNAPLATFNAQGFPITTPMVAAFWADVDTRNSASGSVWYKVFPDRLVVTWNRVGYYNVQADLKNTFQLTIKNNTVAGFTGNDIIIAYDDMQWTTGSASNGTGGFGGIPATVGANRGNNVDYIQTGRFNLNSNQPPNNPTVGTPGGIDWLDQQCLGYQVGPVGNVPPAVAGLPSGNTLTLTQGETRTVQLQFSGPEVSQTVGVTSNLNGLCNATATTSGNNTSNPTTTFSVTGSACNLGTNTVSFTAVDNGSPAAQATFTLTVVVNPLANGQWTGAVNSVYTLPGNWSSGVVPAAADNVSIPSGVPNFPVLTTAAAATNFTVATGASMTVGAGGTLTLNGNLANNGTFSGAGSLASGGPAAQAIQGNSFTIGNLSVGSAGLVLNTPLSVRQLVSLDGNLTSNGNLTLLSTAQGTAMVVNNGAAQVQGTATVQRYLDPSLNAGLGYRHLAAPVQSTTLNDLATPGFTPVTNSAYNTAAEPSTVTPFPTVFGYDQTRVNASGSAGATDFDRGWVSPVSLADAMTPGVGYTVNVTGGLTPDFVGTLNNGAISQTGLTRGPQTSSGWHLLGNPYPAPIDWNAAFARATGLENAVYVFKSSGTYAGSYASFVNGVGTARYIGVSQGFFVRVANASTSGSMAFDNSTRLTSYQDVAVQRPVGPAEQRPLLQLDLANDAGARDAAYVYFEQGATTGFDARFDAHKLTAGAAPYLATLPAGPTAAQSISGLPALTGADVTVPLGVWVPQAGTYTLRAEQLLNLPTSTYAYLRDQQTGALTDLRQQPNYSCWLPAATYLPTRFSLVFTQQRVLGTAPAALSQQVALYPTPAHGTARLQLPASLRQHPTDAVLLNALGQQVRRYALASQGPETELPLHGLAPGVYTLRLATPAGLVTKRLLVE